MIVRNVSLNTLLVVSHDTGRLPLVGSRKNEERRKSEVRKKKGPIKNPGRTPKLERIESPSSDIQIIQNLPNWNTSVVKTSFQFFYFSDWNLIRCYKNYR
jgi:hypothetical protein